MKKIVTAFIISLMFIVSTSVITAQEKAEGVYLSKTNKVENADIPELHDRAWGWMSNYFNDEHKQIVKQDLDEEKLDINVEVTLKTLQEKLTFNIVIELKDNEYTYSYSDLNTINNKEEFDRYLSNLSTRIERAMITGFTPGARKQLKN